MKKLTAFIIVLTASLATVEANKPKWEKIRASRGISVYRQEVPGSNHLMFKGKGVVNKEMVYVLSVLGDVKNLSKWIESLRAVKELEYVSDRVRILYNHIGAPWPLTDRDVVVKVKVYYDKKNQWIHIQTANVKGHKKAPKNTGRVRIPFIKSQWSLKSIRGGKATWVEFKVHADPGGILPSWVANMASRNIPFKSITNLRRRVAQGKFNQEVIELFQKYNDELDG